MSRGEESALPHPLGNENIDPSVAGLTKRELFAALAMQGVLAGRRVPLSVYGAAPIAKDAVATADALLAALEKERVSP